ncbi:MAG: coniferyl aldehyde dehydrogenase [Legionellales bacterium]|nr:coniferyl aldehyde dehydrogenase [Legionellales bacterium]
MEHDPFITTPLAQAFSALKAFFLQENNPSLNQRLFQLKKLRQLIKENQTQIIQAIQADFNYRSQTEMKLVEIFPSLQTLDYHIKSLPKWIKPEKRKTSQWFLPGRSRVFHQALGVIGIIVPWNYPLYLTIAPLCAALAAGNRVMIKFSELTPHFATVMTELLKNYLGKEWVYGCQDDGSLAKPFAHLPFNHLFFTGSTRVGKLIMAAASQHLTPITLELGGKSPCIIGETYPLAAACESIVMGKLMNSGQTCIAPDYVLLPKARLSEFIELMKKTVQRFYPHLKKNDDYTAIINQHHYQRLQDYLNDAKNKQAIIINLSADDLPAYKMAPHLIYQVNDTMLIMQEEIFGPLLPIITYEQLEEAINYIQQRPHPLALYYFEHDRKKIHNILTRTLSGGVTINDTLLHIAQTDLPFGGVGLSGLGSYHGREGFLRFSHAKAVFYQSKWRLNRLVYPPYGKLTQFFLKIMNR